jgi:hypothetical protein
MSLEEPDASDTPEDHEVIGLEIDVALLPEWYEAVRDLAGGFCRRMAVMEHPEVWRVRIELPKARADEFRAALGDAWAGFVADRRSRGLWP